MASVLSKSYYYALAEYLKTFSIITYFLVPTCRGGLPILVQIFKTGVSFLGQSLTKVEPKKVKWMVKCAQK